ncbi:hypothetical protein [Paenimyroides aestuarii]|uniref:Uncharacterized protein n=1 Tax=Paenimyroides aestuarii TaxID=2968490 RepID=A0ABY5NVZ6_9FLAO|nr:hypothetical protein [Paenimyroides aestuarii]UUV22725.1 hypothetical protein NPX36_06705 [Paenimyroides aestuarii]
MARFLSGNWQQRPEDYKYSSAPDYADEKGLLDGFSFFKILNYDPRKGIRAETGGYSMKCIAILPIKKREIMFYIYTLLIPMVLLLLGFWLTNTKLKKIRGVVNLIFQMIPHFFGYAFFLYFLEVEGFINSPWAFYTIIFYLLPISAIIIILKFYFYKK